MSGKEPIEKSVRLRGLILTAIGLLVGGGLYAVTLLAARTILLELLILLTVIPALITLAGLLELISGTPFSRTEKTWDALPQALQITLSILVVAGLLGLVVLIFMIGENAATPV